MSLVTVMHALRLERERIARERDNLLDEAPKFEEEINRIVRPWSDEDPVTERPWVSVEGVNASEYWGKRIRLFNGHFIEFTIDKYGVVWLRTSQGDQERFDDFAQGVRPGSTGGGYTAFTLGRLIEITGTGIKDRTGIVVEKKISDFIENAVGLNEYVPPKEKK